MSSTSTTTAAITTGIIGYGTVANKHRQNLQAQSDHFNLTSVCDLTPERRDAAHADGIPECFDDLAAFLKAGIELAVICTHSSTHYAIAKQCLEAGCHVIIEKPVTLDSAEAEELFTIAAERGLVAYVWHNRRFDKDYRAVQELIKERGIGDLLRVENRTAGQRPAIGFGTKDFNPSWRITADMGGGTMWDFGPHWVDQILDLVPGTVTGVLAQVQNVKWGTADDFFHITLIFDSGVHAVASKVDIAYHSFPKWLIFGSEATIWSQAGVNSDVHWKREDEEATISEPTQPPDMLANVFAVIRTGAKPLITPTQALRTAKVLDAARESAAAGKQLAVSI